MIQRLFDHITAENTEEYISGKVDEYMSEYVWDWEDDYEDIYEAYQEEGRGQAESQILNEMIALAKNSLDVEIDIDQHCELFDKLAEHWNLTTD